MSTLIAATDLSAQSARVVARAAQLAARLEARVILAHVLPEDASDEARHDARRGLEAACADGPGAAPPEPVLLDGRPETALSRLAGEEGAEFMILGLHRLRPVLDLLRLTTMERIVLAARVPVLLAHRPVEGAYASVLGAVDFSSASAAALTAAAHLAPEARFCAIHALQLGLIDRLPGRSVQDSRAMAGAVAARDAWLAAHSLPPGLSLPEIVPGGVHEVLRYRIGELEPDLLTIGAHSGHDPSQLGNYARDLMREPPTDVLVAKAADAPAHNPR